MSRDRPLSEILVREAVRLLDGAPETLSLRALARAAGVSAMAPYRHFPDKAALLRAVAAHGFDILASDLSHADGKAGSAGGAAQASPDGAADGRDALVAQGIAYVGFAVRQPALFRLMFQHCPPGGADALGQGAYGIMARRVAAICPARQESATLAAWAIVHGLATLALDGRLSHDPETIRDVLALFAAGLATR